MADAPKENITTIAKDAKFSGEMVFQNTVRVLGTFEGTIKGSGELQVAANAKAKANIEVNSVIVDGTVEGNVFAKDKLQLNATSVVNGDVTAGKMIVAEGAVLFGQCNVGADVVKAGPGGLDKGQPAKVPQQQQQPQQQSAHK